MTTADAKCSENEFKDGSKQQEKLQESHRVGNSDIDFKREKVYYMKTLRRSKKNK